jgi:ATP-dependent exoDNAse (exonuclease V) beta subunit
LKATQNWADKIAWYALLRAPWLGLTLADLLVISQQLKDQTIWSVLLTYQQLEALSANAKARLDSVMPKLQFWLEQKGRISVSEFLRGLWIMLGGPQCYPNAHVLEDMDRILKLVDEYDVGGYLGDIDAFEEAMGDLFADIEPDDEAQDLIPVELMTIHKSKGLEFDHVFIPYLDARPVNASQEWLNWIERTDESHIDLLLATKPARNESCPYFDYLQRQIVKKEFYEAARVLYVGVTRAKQQLYLTSCIEQKEDEVKAPNKGSLLSYLWPHIHQNLSTWNELLSDVPVTKSAVLSRLPTQWQLPREVIQHHQHAKTIIERWDEVAPVREDHQAKLSGIVFHRLMQWCMNSNLNSESTLQQIKKSCQIVLKRYGLLDAELEQAVALVLKAFVNMKDCPKGQWLMSPRHHDIQHEWALMSFENQFLKEYIIDYSFIDENQVRWIIDFKLSAISESNQSEHQVELLRYSKQLQTYRRLLSQKETREVRCGLYFPLTHWWREIA